VNRSTYYKHFFGAPTPRNIENQEIRKAILEIHLKSDKILGGRKIRAVLLRDYGIAICLPRVYRLIKSMNLPKKQTKGLVGSSFVESLSSDDNKLDQNFKQNSPNLVWVSDVTYIRAGGSWAYLCAVIDLFSRKVIAYRISRKFDADLACETILDALRRRGYPRGLMFHSDRGAQYTAFATRNILDKYDIVQSFSNKGHPWDNAVNESFFRYLKEERTNRDSYRSLDELKLEVFKYIESFYNSYRPHGSIGYLTPDEAERRFYTEGRTPLCVKSITS